MHCCFCSCIWLKKHAAHPQYTVYTKYCTRRFAVLCGNWSVLEKNYNTVVIDHLTSTSWLSHHHLTLEECCLYSKCFGHFNLSALKKCLNRKYSCVLVGIKFQKCDILCTKTYKAKAKLGDSLPITAYLFQPETQNYAIMLTFLNAV